MMIFSPNLSEEDFEKYALSLFHYQFDNNFIYQAYCKGIGCNKEKVLSIIDIPFLPIEFFKTQKIVSGFWKEEAVFSSSGTTNMVQSKHYIKDLSLYLSSCLEGFKYFYGDPKEWVILALLPSYLEREGSSLILMVKELMQQSGNPNSGWFLNEFEQLNEAILTLESKRQKTLLFGVTYALLDFAESFPITLKNTIIMETGGMKGNRKEMTKNEVHQFLRQNFQTKLIHSEYGMCELFSQAYSKENEIFQTPPWMKILIRDINDPLSLVPDRKSGGINVIDLANRDSCAFIATQDLGVLLPNGGFKILGRFDYSDVRGCNLLVV